MGKKNKQVLNPIEIIDNISEQQPQINLFLSKMGHCTGSNWERDNFLPNSL